MHQLESSSAVGEHQLNNRRGQPRDCAGYAMQRGVVGVSGRVLRSLWKIIPDGRIPISPRSTRDCPFALRDNAIRCIDHAVVHRVTAVRNGRTGPD